MSSDTSENSHSIERRIDHARQELQPTIRDSGAAGQAHLAWRMVVDLVAGIGIGAGVGYGLGHLFGMLPIFMIIFILLGFAAGVNLMWRTAREFRSESLRGPTDERKN